MNTADEYPTLHADLATVKDIINPGFIRADRVALRLQRYFRLSEMILIIGAVIAVVLGAVATAGAVADNSSNPWSIAEAFLTFALGTLAFVARRLRWHDKWLRQRTIAETLRGEQFLFLGRMGPYEQVDNPVRMLEKRVLEIERRGVDTNG